MPKYYRFRPTIPSQRFRKAKDKENDEKRNKDVDNGWFNVTLACSLGPPWYLRRNSWRLHTTVSALGKLVDGLPTSLQLGNRPILVFARKEPDLFE